MSRTKGIWIYLFILGIPAAFAAVAAALISHSYFNLSQPASAIIAMGGFGLVALMVAKWLNRSYAKGQETIASTNHPYFGQVDSTRTAWRTKMDVPELGDGLCVESAAGTEPTSAQITTAQWICTSGSVITTSIENWFENHEEDTTRRTSKLLFIRFIRLHPDTPKSFKILFDFDNRRPCGYTAIFENERLLAVE